jgi:hypothetical protein
MLFLLRPRQTRMPYAVPRDRSQQAVYNEQLQTAYAATRRVAPYDPGAGAPHDRVADLRALAELHQSGALSDTEFATAKTKVLAAEDAPT